jgi:hypothetical protein
VIPKTFTEALILLAMAGIVCLQLAGAVLLAMWIFE